MDITEQFLNFTLLGAEWVLWVLIALSILSVGVMIERFLFFGARHIDTERLARDARAALESDDTADFDKRYKASLAMAAEVARVGVQARDRGPDVVSEVMYSAKTRGKRDHERYLIVLGTLGNNAPFIGLFGTVLGIIKAFHDLSSNAQGGAEVVMSGISEALVATAVGLLVAIPAVIAFNYFNRRVRDAVTRTDEIAHAILAEVHGRDRDEEAA
jgi:biopolymer transport protein ExbB